MEDMRHDIAMKFNLVARLIAKLKKLETTKPMLCFRKAKKELKAIHLMYILCTSHLHFQATTRERGCLVIQDEFHLIIASENFLIKLDYLVWRVQVELGLRDHHQLKGAALLDQYTRHGIDCIAKPSSTPLQPSEGSTTFEEDTDTSELTCAECRKV